MKTGRYAKFDPRTQHGSGKAEHLLVCPAARKPAAVRP